MVTIDELYQNSSSWSLSFRFTHQNVVYISLLPIRVTCLAHLVLLDLSTLMGSTNYEYSHYAVYSSLPSFIL